MYEVCYKEEMSMCFVLITLGTLIGRLIQWVAVIGLSDWTADLVGGCYRISDWMADLVGGCYRNSDWTADLVGCCYRNSDWMADLVGGCYRGK